MYIIECLYSFSPRQNTITLFIYVEYELMLTWQNRWRSTTKSVHLMIESLHVESPLAFTDKMSKTRKPVLMSMPDHKGHETTIDLNQSRHTCHLSPYPTPSDKSMGAAHGF